MYLSIVHLNSNAAVRVAGSQNDAVELNGSEVKTDLKLRAYHKLLRCNGHTNSNLSSVIALNSSICKQASK